MIILGVGGAGGRIAGAACPGAEDVEVIIANADVRELEAVPAPVKLQIGAARTNGLGTGGDPGVGRLAMTDDLPALRELIAEKSIVMVAAGLGGGTGSGAAPVALRAAREAGALTIALVTLPFGFEGQKRAATAGQALREVREACDTVIVLDNDRLFASTGEARVERAFAHGTTVMSSALRALCHLITRPGYINLDIADLREMVRHSGGSCALGYARASGEGRVAAVLHDLLEGTLLQEGERVREAGALLVGIVGGPDLAVHEVGNIMQAINGVTTESCNVTMGTTINEDQSDVIEVLALVSEIWTGEPSPAQGQAEGNQRRRRKGAVGGKARHTQALLGLQMAGRGRFKNVEATVVDGEDLDIPTFTRRGISLDA